MKIEIFGKSDLQPIFWGHPGQVVFSEKNKKLNDFEYGYAILGAVIPNLAQIRNQQNPNLWRAGPNFARKPTFCGKLP